LCLEQLAVKSFGKEDAAAAIEWAATSGTWKLSSDGWMRELEINAEDSHLLAYYYATTIWTQTRSKARTELKKQQEREERKRPAEGQPEGTAEAKRDKQTR
jgi:hypothetical protein